VKAALLNVNDALLFFGTTLYVGVLWAMRFFWYPSWELIRRADVPVHFVGPTSRATAFFTVVVPIMLVTNIILLVREWRRPATGRLAGLALACIGLATLVGKFLIIPINQRISVGLPSESALHDALGMWMHYNTIRFWLMTMMWVSMMAYFTIRARSVTALQQGVA
jgi:hypothetical protein